MHSTCGLECCRICVPCRLNLWWKPFWGQTRTFHFRSHQDLWRGRPRALGSVPPKWEGWVRRGATNVSIHYASIQNWIIHTTIVHKYSHSVTFINPQYINFITIFPQYFSMKNGAAFEGDQKLSINRTSANLHGLSNDSVLCSAPLRAKVRPMGRETNDDIQVRLYLETQAPAGNGQVDRSWRGAFRCWALASHCSTFSMFSWSQTAEKHPKGDMNLWFVTPAIQKEPIFCPAVGDFKQGMVVSAPQTAQGKHQQRWV